MAGSIGQEDAPEQQQQQSSAGHAAARQPATARCHITVRRSLVEPEAAWRARFDEVLRAHAESVVRPCVRAHLAAHADRVRAAWAHLDTGAPVARA